MTREFEAIVQAEPGPSLLDALEVGFVFFAVPTLNVSGEKVRLWLRRKNAIRRLGAFADLARSATALNVRPAYINLVRHSGLASDAIDNALLTDSNRGSR